MTMFRRGFAAEQDRRHREQVAVERLLDFPVGDQGHEIALVLLPAPLLFLVGVEHLLRRGEERLVHVIGATQFAQEVLQIFALGEAGQLRDVVQPDVNQALDSVATEDSEELGGSLLRETDRKDFHGFIPGMSNSKGCSSSGAGMSS